RSPHTNTTPPPHPSTPPPRPRPERGADLLQLPAASRGHGAQPIALPPRQAGRRWTARRHVDGQGPCRPVVEPGVAQRVIVPLEGLPLAAPQPADHRARLA